MTRRLLSIALLGTIAACTSLAGLPTDAPAPSPTAPPVSTPSQAPSRPPATVALVTPRPTATPRPERSDPPPPTVAHPSGEPMPPDAVLSLPDGTRQAGALGSYFYGGAAADAPWLPARVLPKLQAQPGSVLVLAVPPLEFVSWGARYADAADEDADVISPLASGGDGGAALSEVTLPAPPRGSWVLAVQLYFADEEGDATYYWHVRVP